MNAYGKHQLKDEKTKEIKIKIIFPNETTKSITMVKDRITYDLYGVINELLTKMAKANEEDEVEDFYLMSFQKVIPNIGELLIKMVDLELR